MKAANNFSATASRADLSVAFMLASLLERLEHSVVPVGPEQYRSIVGHLRAELIEVQAQGDLALLLERFPATSELYENLHYAQAGLCRSDLEAATRSELAAQSVIAQARRSG
ncbi:MAG: hypothetical protein ABIO45_18350 [Burkholderiaceae bacterium]